MKITLDGDTPNSIEVNGAVFARVALPEPVFPPLGETLKPGDVTRGTEGHEREILAEREDKLIYWNRTLGTAGDASRRAFNCDKIVSRAADRPTEQQVAEKALDMLCESVRKYSKQTGDSWGSTCKSEYWLNKARGETFL